MFDLTANQSAALAKRVLKRRVFVYCWARDPITGLPDPAGFWDDVGTVELDGLLYHGSGTVVLVSTISARGDLTIPGLTVSISGVASESAALVRGSSVGQARIAVKLGIYDVATQTILPPLIPFFDGRVDNVDIETPPAGETSTIRLTCESSSRALTIQRPDTRSPASLNALWPSDKFYDFAGVQRDKPLYFGKAAP